jgi:hypothetical protein
MAFEPAKREAMHLLQAIEDGRKPPADLAQLLEDADPALAYLTLQWLRAHYPPGHSAAEGVLGRIVATLSERPSVTRHVKSGERDAIAQWFEEAYDVRELDREAFVDTVVDKLEG